MAEPDLPTVSPHLDAPQQFRARRPRDAPPRLVFLPEPSDVPPALQAIPQALLDALVSAPRA